MKGIRRIFLFILICFIYTACYGKERMGFGTREKMNLDVAEKIVNCISEKDKDGLKNLFSEEVISSDLNLENDIERLFEFCNDKIIYYEKIAMGMDTSINGELNSTEFHTEFRLLINQTNYLLYYIYIPKNLYDSRKVGIRSLKIVKEVDDDKYFCYWQRMKIGIFIPEE